MRLLIYVITLFSAFTSKAVDFTAPASWKLVNTNAVERWQRAAKKRSDADFLSLNGVVADKSRMEVRLLAEAVGHGRGITTEFMLIGPRSDRAYESLAVTVASPAAIVKAVEFLGIGRGSCVDASEFKFVPRGERFEFFVRRVGENAGSEEPIGSLIAESVPDDPLFPERGFVFAGGEWSEEDGKSLCLTATVPPCSVISLYNNAQTIFDIPHQAGQSAVYGRLTVKTALPYGTLLEVIARPLHKESRVLSLDMTLQPDGDNFALRTVCEQLDVQRDGTVQDSLRWLRKQSEAGYDLYVTLKFDDNLSVSQARDGAALFEMLADSGVHLYGKGENSVYYKAFLPQQQWRKREGRNPQPFEVHITRDESGAVKKKLIFIEEDWSVEGLDPKLTPREYPFEHWSELEPLVNKVGGENNKVIVLFLFAPADMKISEIMPAVNVLSERLPLVHVFSDVV